MTDISKERCDEIVRNIHEPPPFKWIELMAESADLITALRARVDELERERDEWRKLAGQGLHGEHRVQKELLALRSHIAELYVERDQAQAALAEALELAKSTETE